MTAASAPASLGLVTKAVVRIMVVFGALTGVFAVASEAGAQAAQSVQILSPRPDALVTSGVVTVRVRTPGTRTVLKAYVRGRRLGEITSRFGPARRGVRRARLRFGRQLVAGPNHLFVQVRRRSRKQFETKQVHFTVGRRARGMLRVTGVGGGTERAPIAVQARAPRAGELRATLNGRDVAPVFDRDDGGRWRATLAASDGLRFGANRLTVTAFNREGSYQRIQRTFRIRRTGPLVGAGRDRRVRKGRALLLDGRSTRASGHRRNLRLRWQIASRPEGSKAKLTSATSARPRLRPDLSGRYTIRLHATERPRRDRIAMAAQAPATDIMTVTAQPDVPPSGIPITTIVSSSNPGVQLGEQFYALGSGWLQMLAIDRATPDQSPPIANTSYPGTDQGMAALASAVNALSDDLDAPLVILSAGGRPASLSSNGSKTLVGVVNELGGILQPGTGSVSGLVSGQWSLIGIPGLPQGQAEQFIGLQSGPGEPAGSMSGSLQQDASGNYTFTWPPAYVTFDTQAPGTAANQNVISVGSQTYASQPLLGGQSGLHVVWLDSGTLVLKGHYTALTTARGESFCEVPGLQCVWELARELQSIVNSQGPALLLVASIGKPVMSTSGPFANAWGTVAQTLNSMGAQPYVLLGLDGAGDYSFVGNQGLLQLEGPNSGTELGQAVAGSPTARLTGLLKRNAQGNWTAGTNGSPGPGVDPTLFQPSLQQVLAQPEQGFPAFDDGGEQDAEQWIFGKLFPNQTMNSAYGIRAMYWDSTIKWNDEEDDLMNPGVVPVCSTSPACAEAFPDVQQTLRTEFTMVDQVRSYFTQLEGILNTAFGQNSVAFQGVWADILKLYNKSGSPNAPDATAILGDALTIASGAAALTPGGEAPSAGLAIAAGASTLIGEFANDSGGGSALDPSEFEGDINQWGQELIDAWTTGIASADHIADLLVSDWGRLQTAVTNINTVTGPDSWNLGNGAQLTRTLNRSATQYMWQTMLPVAVRVVDWYCYDNYGRFIAPAGVSQTAQFHPNWVTESSSGYGIGNPYLFPVGPDLRVPDEQTVLDLLFSPPTVSQPNNLGLKKQYFWAGAWMAGGKAVTPGFVYAQPQGDIWEHYAYGVNPPRGCLSSP